MLKVEAVPEQHYVLGDTFMVSDDCCWVAAFLSKEDAELFVRAATDGPTRIADMRSLLEAASDALCPAPRDAVEGWTMSSVDGFPVDDVKPDVILEKPNAQPG